MRIAFITDLHIAGAGEMPYGVDVRQNFLNALAYVKDLHPDVLVLGGDICYNVGDEAIYQWVNEQITDMPFPVYVIPGNHDDTVMLCEHLRFNHHLQNGELYYALPLEGYPALFLDTSKGEMSEAQWTWFTEHLQALRDNNVLVFMHHPPVKAHVAFMDANYPFRQSERFLELVKNLPCHVTAICGHYHVEKWVQRGNLTVLVTPSLYFQMKHQTEEVVIDHYRPAVREFIFDSDGLYSTVHYLEAERQDA